MFSVMTLAATMLVGAHSQEEAAAVGEIKIKVDEEYATGVFAREPMVKDPVAFAIDPATGRIAVCESFRQSHGVEDNRSSPYWLEDDLAAQTVEDRRAYMLKWAGKFQGGERWFTEKEDRLRMLVDVDDDGVADHVEILADGFNDVVDGTGSGALWVDSDLWYTNIPHLWRLRDLDQDGTPEQLESMYEGFGVRSALRGHDMHGLTFGPDGRIYFSIGDRGYNVELPDGRALVDPHDGAVFRCERDGSNLEVFATGLRNPQELAFDRFGNLFTGDNNSDAGDRARLVYVVEDGESGWNMSYQTLSEGNERGPWNQEGIWWVERPLDPAWTLPPIAHLGSGPSGFAFYPGTGLPERYEDHLFLCDFLGGDENSSVRAFAVEPRGAGFELVDSHKFVRNVLATDVAFGPDGRLYVSDWGGGWNSNGTGQIYTVWHPELIESEGVVSAHRILAEGFKNRFDDELVDLLAHPHRDVRLFAQYELAGRGEDTTDLLEETALSGFDFNARLHATWGLGMQARTTSLAPEDAEHPGRRLLPLLEDRDPELRAQGASLIGSTGILDGAEPLRGLLFDENARVRYFAAMSLGKLGVRESAPEIAAVLAENADEDLFLRHAGVMAFTRLGEEDRDLLNELAAHTSRSVRLASLLAMRRLQDPHIARFLHDPDPMIVLEAARAINDMPIREAWPDLADELARFGAPTEYEESPEGPVVLREVWRKRKNVPREGLATLEIFDTEPDETEILDRFAGPIDDDEQYVSRLTSTLVAPQSGEYVFWLASDDDSILLVRKESESETWEIARVDGWVAPGSWEEKPSQRSEPIHLEEGDSITLEVRHAEGNGGDHVAVGWTLPDGPVERPIGGGMVVADAWVTPLLRRAVNVAVRLGDPIHARMLADVARNQSLPEPVRIDAMEALAEWAAPHPRDRVIGNWRPVSLQRRDLESWQTVLATRLPGLVSHGSGRVRRIAQDLAADRNVPLDGEINFTILADESVSSGERVAALRQIVRDGSDRLDESFEVALASGDPELRAETRVLYLDHAPDRALPALVRAVQEGTLFEQQAAVRALARTDSPVARTEVATLLARMPDRLDPALQMDVFDAARSMDAPLMREDLRRLDAWLDEQPHGSLQFALEGGDPERGRRIVRNHTAAQCMRCHRIEGIGGEAGPMLDGVAAHRDKDYMLQSLLDPSAVIVEGYGDASAMPPVRGVLSPTELRDVVAYLGTFTEERAPGH